TGCSSCHNTLGRLRRTGAHLDLVELFFSSSYLIPHGGRRLARSGLFMVTHGEYFCRTQLYSYPTNGANLKGFACNRDLRIWVFQADFQCPAEVSSGSPLSILLPLDLYNKGSDNGAADALLRVHIGELLSLSYSFVTTDLAAKIALTLEKDDALQDIVAKMKQGGEAKKHYQWVNEKLIRKVKLVVEKMKQ
nr:hypothetical protein [Tanacetum cinerariifolium]